MTSKHQNAVALRKAGQVGDNFAWFSWRCIGTDAIQMVGCTSSGVRTRGPRKGRPRYDGPRVTVVITEAEVEAERHRFERETGQCGRCGGEGTEFKSWSIKDGLTLRPCDDCNGSGKKERDL